jgi:hypothetical protein
VQVDEAKVMRWLARRMEGCSDGGALLEVRSEMEVNGALRV